MAGDNAERGRKNGASGSNSSAAGGTTATGSSGTSATAGSAVSTPNTSGPRAQRARGRGAATNIEPIPDSVVREPLPGEYGFSDYVLWLASAADEIPQWGSSPAGRDRLLRNFWTTEPILAGAVFTIASRYTAFEWELTGPKRLVDMYSTMIHSSQQGKGWLKLMMPFVIDYLTQDNGAFMEVVRADNNDPTSPVVTLNHLDSNRCTRTGRLETPVLYMDRWGKFKLLRWYEVIEMTEMPSPVETMRGMQYCAVSRALRAAQTARDISIHNHEKLSGRFTKAIHLVGGVQTKTVNDAIAVHRAENRAQGLTHYSQPVVIGSLDPTASVSHELIELASLPEGFDEESQLKQYIIILALAFGVDYQEFAPMMSRGGGGGGSAGGAETMHLKARGKGPTLFMQNMEHAFNFHGVFPKNVGFKYSGQDTGEDLDDVKLALLRAEERAMRIKSGELTPEVARQIAVDCGDLDERFLAELKAADELAKQEQQEMFQQGIAAKTGAGAGGDADEKKRGGGATAKDGNMQSPQAPQRDRTLR